MKKKVIVIDDVDDADSLMDDYDDGYRRFMANAVSEHTSSLSERIDVPIICLDEDDNDDLIIDKDYSVFLDHLRGGDNLSPSSEVDNGESDTRKFKIFTCDSKRSKLGNENPIKNRVSQQGKRKTVGFKAERVKIREDIQRDNRVAERRKRRIAELEAAKNSRPVPVLRTQEDIQQRDSKVRKISELKAETLRDVPLIITQEDSQRDSTVSEGIRERKADELKAETLRKAVPLVSSTEEDIQRDNTVSEGRERKADELKAETLRKAVPLVSSTEEDIQRDNRIAERRKRKFSETKAAETSRVVHVERVNRVTELKDIDETSGTKEFFVGRRKKNEEEGAAVVDKDYMRYLTWLVDSLRDSTTKPMANLQKDQSDFDHPFLDTLKESTNVPEKDPLVQVKIEQDLESWSDDSDIIAIGDTPFLDGEGTPFVASKKVVDLDEGSNEDDSSSSWFRKELMDVLKKPYDEGEFTQLHREASIHRRMTRCRELRKGRVNDYETDELGQSYLENFPDFEKEYKLVDGGVDKARALKLLRGFFFYLKYVSHDGAFKPWEKNQWW